MSFRAATVDELRALGVGYHLAIELLKFRDNLIGLGVCDFSEARHFGKLKGLPGRIKPQLIERLRQHYCPDAANGQSATATAEPMVLVAGAEATAASEKNTSETSDAQPTTTASAKPKPAQAERRKGAVKTEAVAAPAAQPVDAKPDASPSMSVAAPSTPTTASTTSPASAVVLDGHADRPEETATTETPALAAVGAPAAVSQPEDADKRGTKRPREEDDEAAMPRRTARQKRPRLLDFASPYWCVDDDFFYLAELEDEFATPPPPPSRRRKDDDDDDEAEADPAEARKRKRAAVPAERTMTVGSAPAERHAPPLLPEELAGGVGPVRWRRARYQIRGLAITSEDKGYRMEADGAIFPTNVTYHARPDGVTFSGASLEQMVALGFDEATAERVCARRMELLNEVCDFSEVIDLLLLPCAWSGIDETVVRQLQQTFYPSTPRLEESMVVPVTSPGLATPRGSSPNVLSPRPMFLSVPETGLTMPEPDVANPPDGLHTVLCRHAGCPMAMGYDSPDVHRLDDDQVAEAVRAAAQHNLTLPRATCPCGDEDTTQAVSVGALPPATAPALASPMGLREPDPAVVVSVDLMSEPCHRGRGLGTRLGVAMLAHEQSLAAHPYCRGARGAGSEYACRMCDLLESSGAWKQGGAPEVELVQGPAVTLAPTVILSALILPGASTPLGAPLASPRAPLPSPRSIVPLGPPPSPRVVPLGPPASPLTPLGPPASPIAIPLGPPASPLGAPLPSPLPSPLASPGVPSSPRTVVCDAAFSRGNIRITGSTGGRRVGYGGSVRGIQSTGRGAGMYRWEATVASAEGRGEWPELAAEGLVLLLQRVPKKRPTKAPEEAGWACAKCGTTAAVQRRAGPQGKGTLCNSCGLKFQRRPEQFLNWIPRTRVAGQ